MKFILKILILLIISQIKICMKRFFQGLKTTKRKYPYYNNYNFPTKFFHKTFKEDKVVKSGNLILNIKGNEYNIFDKIYFF